MEASTTKSQIREWLVSLTIRGGGGGGGNVKYLSLKLECRSLTKDIAILLPQQLLCNPYNNISYRT